ncbi:MAG: C_GCAxxG_C_C family protein [Candidatus Hydrogenedentota bacterium]|nr:MAG: C_GCAxxG_C_C family protein [Candidatus Hydrogenedentota bacterium]
MQDLLGLGDARKLKSVAGLAGGVGHQGAACGILVGGALALGLASADADEDQAAITAKGCMYAAEFVRRFSRECGSTLCRDIARTDFADDWQLRKYILAGSRKCIKLASKSASIMVDILNQTNREPDKLYRELNRRFSENDFHCGYSVARLASEELDINPMLPPNMLIPLNGGIGYSGSTCAALLGGCSAVGLVRGGDSSQTGTLMSFRRLALTLIQGSAAFNRLDLSPANDALLRCAELCRWFESRFHSLLCREIVQTDFRDRYHARRYFERNVISKCILMAEQTAAKAAELTR